MPRLFPSRPTLVAMGRWAGVALCVAITGLWLVSGWYRVYWQVSPTKRSWAFIEARQGQARFGVMSGATLPRKTPWYGRTGAERMPRLLFGPEPGNWAFTPEPPRWRWGFDGSVGDQTFVFIPFWTLFISVALGTTVLWRRSRTPIGHCQCGYCLAGLKRSGSVCPECGAVLSRAAAEQP